MTPKVSVIVPVYKAEAYLHRCVDSILSQTFQDFEVLLIDDGSPDKSGEICDEYAKKDNRVRVFHKENGGVSSARNLAIGQSKGEWMCFVDSDDYWESRSFLKIIEDIHEDVDIVHFGYKKEYKNRKFRRFCDFADKKIIDKESFFQRGKFSSCSVSFLFKTSHIKLHNLYFNQNIKYSEDREFIIMSALLTRKKILLLPNCDYIYTYNISSATNTLRDFKHCKDDLIVIENIFELIQKLNITLSPSIKSFVSYLMIDSFMLSVCTICKEHKLSEAKSELQMLCRQYPEIDYNFRRFHAFIKFPLATYVYYNLRRMIRIIRSNF